MGNKRQVPDVINVALVFSMSWRFIFTTWRESVSIIIDDFFHVELQESLNAQNFEVVIKKETSLAHNSKEKFKKCRRHFFGKRGGFHNFIGLWVSVVCIVLITAMV